jgi:GxxExxY protein
MATKRHEKTQNKTIVNRSMCLLFCIFSRLFVANVFGGPTVKWDSINALCDIVLQTSFAIHGYHRHGHLEKIYENALAHRLRKVGLKVEQQHPLKVFDEDGTELGEFFADLLIEECLIAELKAVSTVTNDHVAQILGYLRSARLEHGLLINFGAPRFSIKKYIMTLDGSSVENS